jgi:hypothetical protein
MQSTRSILILLIQFAVLIGSGNRTHIAQTFDQTSSTTPNRISFDISTYEERADGRELLAETTVEGPPGTDFEIKLQGERFRMDAKLLSDLIAQNSLQMRADLNTRRLYGQSERGLPLYEEDTQKQSLQLGFDEKLILLPFGGSDTNSNSDQLKIEIKPKRSEQGAYIAAGKPRPLEIKILKASPGNSITVEATKVPHRFALVATLLEDGREVARGETQNGLIEQPQEILLAPNSQADATVTDNPLAMTVNISRYIRSRPTDGVAIDFDVFHSDPRQPDSRRRLELSGAGILDLGSESLYDISDRYPTSSGRKYELKVRVELAPGEETN